MRKLRVNVKDQGKVKKKFLNITENFRENLKEIRWKFLKSIKNLKHILKVVRNFIRILAKYEIDFDKLFRNFYKKFYLILLDVVNSDENLGKFSIIWKILKIFEKILRKLCTNFRNVFNIGKFCGNSL